MGKIECCSNANRECRYVVKLEEYIRKMKGCKKGNGEKET
jgi:hypothetical protein